MGSWFLDYIICINFSSLNIVNSMFLFPVVKTMCDCSKIKCSPVKFCEGVIINRIKIVLFSF